MSAVEPTVLPLRFFRLFLEVLTEQVGFDTLSTVLDKADLPADVLDVHSISSYTGHSAAQTYAQIQKAMRTFYGRGARGTLLRVGRLMWSRSLESASISDRTQAQFVRTLPPGIRRKAALDMLARFMREKSTGISIHSLDLDFMLVDHASSAIGQHENSPICFVTLGLLQENLFWATAREHDIEEVSCCAIGGNVCEFRIKPEGK